MSRAQPGSWEYAAEEFTDASELSLLEDIVRERLFVHLQREIPYVVTQVKGGGERWQLCNSRCLCGHCASVTCLVSSANADAHNCHWKPYAS